MCVIKFAIHNSVGSDKQHVVVNRAVSWVESFVLSGSVTLLPGKSAVGLFLWPYCALLAQPTTQSSTYGHACQSTADVYISVLR